MLIMEFDGSCKKNPGGPGGYGVVIKKNGQILDEVVGPLKNDNDLTNNRAEYLALIIGLKYIRAKYPDEPIICKGDSKFVIKQMVGECSVKNDSLFDLWKKASKLAGEMNVSFEWIERKENKRADELSRRMVKPE